jgi:hypothetical protein
MASSMPELETEQRDLTRTETVPSAIDRSRALVIASIAVLAVWLPLYVQRRSAHQPNVDDYLYANLSRQLYDAFAANPLDGIRAVLHTGTVAPLVPLLAAPLTHFGGVEGAVAVNAPLLVALTAGAYMLVRRWVARPTAAVIAAATALTPATLGWSQMLNFSVAASACTLWMLAAYLHSDGFRRWSWSIATGVAVALLSLSRTMTLVYIAALVVVTAAQAAMGARGRALRSSLPQMGAAALTAIVLAGPWWAKSGRAALHWLRSGGDDPSSVGQDTAHGITRGAIDRIEWTLGDLGTVSQVGLVLLVLAAVAVIATRRRMSLDSLAVAGWMVGCFALLSMSSEVGTGFGLPLLCVLVASVGVALTRLPARAALGVAAVAAVLTLAGIVGELVGGAGSALEGPVYRSMVAGSGAPAGTDVDALNRDVVDAIGPGNMVVLLARDDELLNGNGLHFTSDNRFEPVNVSFGSTSSSIIDQFGDERFLITGRTQGPFHPGVDQLAVEAAAREQGFVLVKTWTLSDGYDIRLWKR